MRDNFFRKTNKIMFGANLWKDAYLSRITVAVAVWRGLEHIESVIWRLCDPNTCGVSGYAEKIRGILRAQGFGFPQLQEASSSTPPSRLSAETSIEIHSDPDDHLLSQSGLDKRRQKGENKKRQSPSKKRICDIIIMGSFVLVIIVIFIAIDHRGRGNELKGNLTHSTETALSQTETVLPDILSRNVNSLKLEPSTNFTSNPPLQIYNPEESLIEPSTTTTQTSTSITTIIVMPVTSKSPTLKTSGHARDFSVETPADFDFIRPFICDETSKERVILSGSNAYKFHGFNFSCSSRIDGLLFRDSSFYIDEASAVLNVTPNLNYLGFNGSSICIRNEGIRSFFLSSIYLPNLEYLEFLNLRKGTDCTEIFSWIARTIIFKALKALSFSGVLFSERNRVDIYQLCLEAFNSRKLSRLSISNAVIKEEMFNEIMPSRNFTGIKLYAKNYGSPYAQNSLYNMLNVFLRHCRIVVLETNIPLTYKQFRESLHSISKMGVERLKLSLHLKNCESLSFEFLHMIPKLHALELHLIFSKECQRRAKSSPVVFERLQYLESSNYFSQFKIVSNANFIATGGVSDLHCRDYRKNTTTDGRTELILNRSEDEDCQIN